MKTPFRVNIKQLLVAKLVNLGYTRDKQVVNWWHGKRSGEVLVPVEIWLFETKFKISREQEHPACIGLTHWEDERYAYTTKNVDKVPSLW